MPDHIGTVVMKAVAFRLYITAAECK